MRRFLAIILSFLFAAAWFAADFYSKIWAVENLSYGGKKILPFLNFHLVYNEGAAFSLLSNQSGWQKWLFIFIAIVICLWLLWELVFERLDKTARIAYASILGGAIGNAYDRWPDGKVVDFILLHYADKAFPIFNIADVGITIGVVLIIFYAIMSWWNISSITSVRR